VSLSDGPGLLPSGGEAPHLPVLVDGVDDPVDTGVLPDGLVGGVDQDDLVVFVGRVLVDPVGVQDTEVTTDAANTGLGDGLVVAGVLELVNTVASGLAVGLTLDDGPLATTTANAHAVDDEALLGLVAEPAGLVRARGAGGAVDGGELTKLPAAHAEDEAQHIRLLLLVELLNVLVGTHI